MSTDRPGAPPEPPSRAHRDDAPDAARGRPRPASRRGGHGRCAGGRRRRTTAAARRHEGQGAGRGPPEGAAAQAVRGARPSWPRSGSVRERIERRKAEKAGRRSRPGAKLSGTAADLLAAVRAVESGEKPGGQRLQRRRRPAPRTAPRAPAQPRAGARRPLRRQPRPAAPAAAGRRPSPAVRAVLAEGGAPDALAAAGRRGARRAAPPRRCARTPGSCSRVPGVRPEQADGFARALLGAECRPGRRAAGPGAHRLAAGAGGPRRAHRAGRRRRSAPRSPSARVPDPDAALQSALAEGEVLVFQDALDDAAGRPSREADGGRRRRGAERPVRVLIGLERYALAEESLADGLARLVQLRAEGGRPGADWERAAAGARLRRRADPCRRRPRPGAPHRRRGRPRRTGGAGGRGPRAGPAGLGGRAQRRRPAASGRSRPATPAAGPDGRRGGRAPSPGCCPARRARAGTRTARWRSTCWSSWTRRSSTWRPPRCSWSRCRTGPGWC